MALVSPAYEILRQAWNPGMYMGSDDTDAIGLADCIKARLATKKRSNYTPELQLLAAIITEAIRDVVRENGKWFIDAYFWLRGDGIALAKAITAADDSYWWLVRYAEKALDIGEQKYRKMPNKKRLRFMGQLAGYFKVNFQDELEQVLSTWE